MKEPAESEPGAGGRTERREMADLAEAVGGAHGIADSSLPGLGFVVGYTASGQELRTAIMAALGVAAVMFAIRLVRREPLQFAFAGLFGVAIAAFIADRTGRAEDFFLPGLLLNVAYGFAYLVSILMGRPLLGYLVGPLVGEGLDWRGDPERVRLYSRASWIWVGVFAIRLVVQLPLYAAGAVVALGVAKTAMGLPIFAVAIWLSYLVLHRGWEELGELQPAAESGERG